MSTPPPLPHTIYKCIGRYRYAGYDTTYQYYGMSDDGFFSGMAPCEVGTDCTDCGVKVWLHGSLSKEDLG